MTLPLEMLDTTLSGKIYFNLIFDSLVFATYSSQAVTKGQAELLMVI